MDTTMFVNVSYKNKNENEEEKIEPINNHYSPLNPVE